MRGEGMKIDKPLGGDPGDLGNIHRPTIEELSNERLAGIPRFNYWVSGLLSGNDGNYYAFYLDIIVPWETYSFGVALLSGLSVEDEGFRQFHVRREIVKNTGCDRTGEKIVVWAPGDGERHRLAGDYGIYEIMEGGRYRLGMNIIDEEVPIHLELECSSSGMPFWYNRGRAATIFPNGIRIAGIEEVCSASGYIVFGGKRVELRGFTDHEHFYNEVDAPEGNILDGIARYGGEYWMPFYSEGVHGIFVTFDKYLDGGIILGDQGEYLIPTDLEIKVLKRYKGYDFPTEVQVLADTDKGLLQITHRAIGLLYGNETISKVSGTFKYEDGGAIEIVDGFGWIEHITPPEQGDFIHAVLEKSYPEVFRYRVKRIQKARG
ncbi:TPA: hypothetical protein ENG04_09980 [Candidatus Poribacteria bacterium]|nr:hypothetical protein [Candidatus Poribacteria bacterium]HEX30396.1 hypothetical protein [Candidatus Poribacteria bacterium]